MNTDKKDTSQTDKELAEQKRKEFAAEIDRNKRSLYADMMEIRRKFSQS